MSYFKLQSFNTPHVEYPPIWAPQLYGGAYADCIYKKNKYLQRSGYRWPQGIEGCRDAPMRYRGAREGFAPLPSASKKWRVVEPGLGFKQWYGRIDPPFLVGREQEMKHMQWSHINGHMFG